MLYFYWEALCYRVVYGEDSKKLSLERQPSQCLGLLDRVVASSDRQGASVRASEQGQACEGWSEL